MAYYGTTAASSVSNPPRCLVAPFATNPALVGSTEYLQSQLSTASNNNNAPGGGGGGLWYYTSTNLSTDLVSANFFSDAFYIGMRAGDIVMGAQIATSAGTTLVTYMGALTAVTTAGSALSTGTLISSTFS